MTESASCVERAKGLSMITFEDVSCCTLSMNAQHTMFPCPQRLLRKRNMCIGMRRHHNEIYIRVRKEIFRCSVVRHMWEIDSAVHALADGCWICRLLCSLKDRNDFVIGYRIDEWKVEALCREAVADYADFDWRHTWIVLRCLLLSSRIQRIHN
jgi:hypothetical protein